MNPLAGGVSSLDGERRGRLSAYGSGKANLDAWFGTGKVLTLIPELG